ncbi:MAG: O-antigen polymerase [Marinobacterium sp.]
MFFFFADALYKKYYKKYYGGFNRLKDVGICFFIFFVVLFKSYLDGGRGGIIIDFIGLFFVFYWFSGKINISYLLAVLVFSIFIGFFGKTFIFSLYSDSSQNNYFYDILNEIKFFDGVVIEYSHQYLSLLVAVQNDLGGSRLFADFIYWLMKPLKLLGFSVADSIAYYNTYIIKGKWDSEIPPGALAFAYYQGGLIFIPLFGIFLGVFFSKLNSAIINSIQHSKYNGESYALVLSICVILTTYFPFSVVNSDPALFVQWSFCFIILFFVFVFLGVVKFRKIKYK